MFEEFDKQDLAQWQANVEKDLKGKDPAKLRWQTFEGQSVEPFYTAQQCQDLTGRQLIPGQFPYLRSQKELSNGWLIREEVSGSKNAKGANKKALQAIENGAHSLVFVLDPTAQGFDGIPVHNLEDMESLLAGIDLSQTGISFKAGNASSFYTDLLAAYADKIGIAQTDCFGSVDFDPIGSFLTSGNTYRPLTSIFDLLSNQIKTGQKKLPHYKRLSIQSHHFHQGGASLVEELAMTLALGNEYLQALHDRGHSLDDYFAQIQISLSVGSSYFQEIAKIRAMRWLWATLASQYSDKKEAQAAYIVAKTSQWNKSVYDPYVNMLRLTTESMSATIAGADEVQIDPYDQGFRPTTKFSRRISRNLHHLLAQESHLDKAIDPAGGSYYIEQLSQQMAEEAWSMFQIMEEKGGLIQWAKTGLLQRMLNESRKKREARLAHRKDKFIGVNEFPNIDDQATDLVQSSHETQAYLPPKEEQDELHISHFIKGLEEKNDEHCPQIHHYMAVESFEQLRATVEMLRKEEPSSLPSFFLLPIGHKSMRTARANFALNFYQCAGFDVRNSAGFDSMEAAMKEFAESQATDIVLCASDDAYLTLIPSLTSALKKLNRRPRLILAGHPRQLQEDYEELGIEAFIYAGCDVYSSLKNYLPTPPTTY